MRAWLCLPEPPNQGLKAPRPRPTWRQVTAPNRKAYVEEDLRRLAPSHHAEPHPRRDSRRERPRDHRRHFRRFPPHAASASTQPAAAAHVPAAPKAAAQKAAAQGAPAQKAPAQKAAQKAPAKQPVKALPASRSLKHTFAYQPNYYFCGPAATRIAISAHRKAPSVYTLAKQLGTTTNGTNSAVDITRVLNTYIGGNRYQTTAIPGRTATPKQIGKLRADVMAAITAATPSWRTSPAR